MNLQSALDMLRLVLRTQSPRDYMENIRWLLVYIYIYIYIYICMYV
jgi:hypothetical protein